MKIAIVLYMPALNLACTEFIKNNDKHVTTVFLISESFVETVDPELALQYQKNLHALPAIEMQKALAALQFVKEVTLLDESNLNGFDTVIIPEDEDEIVDRILSKFYPSIPIHRRSGFVRWAKKTVLSKRAPVPTASISIDELDKELMNYLFGLAEKSPDWWRQVATIIFPVKGSPILEHNRHLPHAQTSYMYGDPRSNFKPGENIDLSLAIHAEAGAIAYAAKKGIVLEGAKMYVTTFPCPPCARLIKEAGIKKVYYCEGYSLMDAEEIFRSAGISLVFVDVPL